MARDSTFSNPLGWHLHALLVLTLVPLAGLVCFAAGVWLVCEVVPWVRRDGGVFLGTATGLLILGGAWIGSGLVGATARWKGGRRLRRALWLVAAGSLTALVPLGVMTWRFWPSLVEGAPWPDLEKASVLVPLVIGLVGLSGAAAAVIAIAGGARLNALPPRVRPRPQPEGIRVTRFSNIVSAKPLIAAALLGVALASLHWLDPADVAAPPPGPFGEHSKAEWVELLRHPRTRTSAAEHMEALGVAAVPVWEALARAECRRNDGHREKVVELAAVACRWFLRESPESYWWPYVDGQTHWRRTAAMGLERLARRGEAPVGTLAALPVQLGYLAAWEDGLRSALPRSAEAIDAAVFDGGERGSQPYLWSRAIRYLRTDLPTRTAVDDIVAEMVLSDDRHLRSYACQRLPELGSRANPLVAELLRSRDPDEQSAGADVCTELERIDGELFEQLRTIAGGLSPGPASAAQSAVLKHRPTDPEVWPMFLRGLSRSGYLQPHQLRAVAALPGPAPARFQAALQALRWRRRYPGIELAKVLAPINAPAARAEFRRIVAAGSYERGVLLREPGFETTLHAAWTVEQALRHDGGFVGWSAAHAVDRWGLESPVLLRLLAGRLTSPSAPDRLAAVRGLTAQRSEAATVRLLLAFPAVADPHPVVRAAALAGQARLGGDYARALRFIRPRLASAPTVGFVGVVTVISWDSKLSRLLEPELRAYARVAPGIEAFSADAALRRAYYPDRVRLDPDGPFSLWWH